MVGLALRNKKQLIKETVIPAWNTQVSAVSINELIFNEVMDLNHLNVYPKLLFLSTMNYLSSLIWQGFFSKERRVSLLSYSI